MILKIKGFCKNCSNTKFEFSKISKGDNKNQIIINETLNHDGWGYDLNTFDVICSKCKEVNSDIFKFEEVKE